MKGKRFSEEQIIRILHEAESLDNVREVCRQHNIAEQTLYRWRRQFGGLEVSEAKRLRALERLVGELMLDTRMLKEVVGKNW
jgi:putative transposase